MKKLIFWLVLLCLFNYPAAQASELSLSDHHLNNTQISLLTYSPGKELYSLFGHSAIRVFNPDIKLDEVYNYGTFNFQEPHFYLKFIKGSLLYSLRIIPFEYVKESLVLENRSLVESPFNLTLSEKRRILEFIRWNALPENRDYIYDFQYDNCSTRILDILLAEAGDSLMVNEEILDNKTFRQHLDPYLKYRPWVHFGIDLLLGLRADKKAKFTDPVFLPDNLHYFSKNIRVVRGKRTKALTGADKILVQKYITQKPKYFTPGLVFWTLALLMLASALIDSYFRPFFRWIGNFMLLITGVLSLILLFLWIFPEHRIFVNNTDILWANPLLLVTFIFRKNEIKGILYYIIISSIILVLLGMLAALAIERNIDLVSVCAVIFIHLLTFLTGRSLKPGRVQSQ